MSFFSRRKFIAGAPTFAALSFFAGSIAKNWKFSKPENSTETPNRTPGSPAIVSADHSLSTFLSLPAVNKNLELLFSEVLGEKIHLQFVRENLVSENNFAAKKNYLGHIYSAGRSANPLFSGSEFIPKTIKLKSYALLQFSMRNISDSNYFEFPLAVVNHSLGQFKNSANSNQNIWRDHSTHLYQMNKDLPPNVEYMDDLELTQPSEGSSLLVFRAQKKMPLNDSQAKKIIANSFALSEIFKRSEDKAKNLILNRIENSKIRIG